jgi:hypothetical protein
LTDLLGVDTGDGDFGRLRLTSPYSSVVHHLSGLSNYALAGALTQRENVRRCCNHDNFASCTQFPYAIGFFVAQLLKPLRDLYKKPVLPFNPFQDFHFHTVSEIVMSRNIT